MKEYIEIGGEKYIIQGNSMKSKKNQYTATPTTPKAERQAYKRKDRVTFELIVLCLFGALSWGVFMYGLISWMA